MNTAQKLDSRGTVQRRHVGIAQNQSAVSKIYYSVLFCSVLFCSVLFCSEWAKATHLTFIYIDIFSTFAICRLCFTIREMSHCCSSPLHSIYLAMLLVIAWGEKVCGRGGRYLHPPLLPACVSSRDGNEWRGAKRQCRGSWWYRDCVWLRFAFAVVLLSLSKGQRRQLDGPTGHPPYQEGLHAGDWLWGARGFVGYLKRSEWI